MKLSRMKTKVSSKTHTTVLRINGQTYKVPSHKVRGLRAALGVPKDAGRVRTLTRNQWTAKPYRWED